MDDIVLTRLDTGAKVFLPPDTRWVDEYEWHAIAQPTPERTLSGGQIIQQGIKKSGRPITLSADNVWLSLADVRRLRDWTDVPELKLQYAHYDGRVFNVAFCLHDTALKAEPVAFTVPELPEDIGTRWRLN